jgi:hypothetical protein
MGSALRVGSTETLIDLTTDDRGHGLQDSFEASALRRCPIRATASGAVSQARAMGAQRQQKFAVVLSRLGEL